MVNQYVQENQDEDEERFVGNWLLVAHWDHVHPSPHGAEDHNGIPQEDLDKVCTRLLFLYIATLNLVCSLQPHTYMENLART